MNHFNILVDPSFPSEYPICVRTVQCNCECCSVALLVLRMSASSFLSLRTELSPGQHATGNMELILLIQNFNHLYLVPASPTPEFHRFLLSSLLAMSRFIRTQCCKETSFLCVCAPSNSLLNTQQTFLAKTFPALLN